MRISDWSTDVCSSDLQFVGAQPPRVGGPAAPIGHDGAAPSEAEHACDGTPALAHRQDIRFIAKGIENRVEQGFRKDGRSKVADAGRVDPVVIAAFGRIASHGDRQPASSEARRVGEEGLNSSRYRGARYHYKKN